MQQPSFTTPKLKTGYYKSKNKEGPKFEEIQTSSQVFNRGSKSPDNNNKRNELISHKEKLKQYKEFKNQVSLKGNQTCRERFSEAGRIRCTHCENSITAKEYHTHIKKCRIEQVRKIAIVLILP